MASSGGGGVRWAQAPDLQLVVDSTPGLIHSGQPDGYLDFFNQAWLRYLGRPLEHLQGWKWTAVIHPDDVEMMEEKWRASLASGEPFLHEARVLRADGEDRWMLHHKVALRNQQEEIVKWYGSSIDIQDRKSAEESLRRSEFYFAEAQRLTHMASWVWQVGGGVALHLSDEWYRIYGFDPKQGRPAWEERLQRVHPEDRHIWQGAIEQAICKKSDYEVEFRILLPDGTLKWVHTVAHPVLGATGELVQFVGSSMDVTERKRAKVGC
jgi:PAS domain S-box-containing protein